jgi:hypothetical protein
MACCHVAVRKMCAIVIIIFIFLFAATMDEEQSDVEGYQRMQERADRFRHQQQEKDEDEDEEEDDEEDNEMIDRNQDNRIPEIRDDTVC